MCFSINSPINCHNKNMINKDFLTNIDDNEILYVEYDDLWDEREMGD